VLEASLSFCKKCDWGHVTHVLKIQFIIFFYNCFVFHCNLMPAIAD
jgi:hypothetical protein